MDDISLTLYFKVSNSNISAGGLEFMIKDDPRKLIIKMLRDNPVPRAVAFGDSMFGVSNDVLIICADNTPYIVSNYAHFINMLISIRDEWLPDDVDVVIPRNLNLCL